MWTVCEFHGSNGNGFGDIWLTTGQSGADVRLSCNNAILLLINGLLMVFKD